MFWSGIGISLDLLVGYRDLLQETRTKNVHKYAVRGKKIIRLRERATYGSYPV